MKSLFRTGETINDVLDDPLDNYPASEGWTMRVILNPRAGGDIITLDTVASGDDHALQVAAAQTATWAPGQYAWEIWAINGAERYFTGLHGQAEIRAGLVTAATGIDTRTQAEKAVDDLKAAYAAWSPTTKSYTINGRSMTFGDPAEIIKAIAFWQRQIEREKTEARIAAGLGGRQTFVVRM